MVSAAQKSVPLPNSQAAAVSFAVQFEQVSGDLSKDVSPDIENKIYGAKASLHEAFARAQISKWNAVKVASAVPPGGGGDMAQMFPEMLSAYMQGGNGSMRLVGLAIEAGSISYDFVMERYDANKRKGMSAEQSHAEAKKETASAAWRAKDTAPVQALQLQSANEDEFDPRIEAEQQAMKKIMVPESGDQNTRSLFGADRALEERLSSLTYRFNVLPPGASDIEDAANDPDYGAEYDVYTASYGINPLPKIA